jgi:predicted metalloprotease
MTDHIVERSDSGVATGMVLGIVVVALAVIVALFFVFGGPGRFLGGSAAPSQTNVNVPAQSQPQNAPNITIPREIDININQQAAPAQPTGDR